jgi:excisionase family DNA binding protein
MKRVSPPGKLLLTPDEAAQVLSVSRSLLYALLASNQIFSVKVRSSRRVPFRALEDYVMRLCDDQKAG